MPFGPYADFDSCVTAQSKDHDVESAKAICGKMQAEMGGSNFVEQIYDANGDLYLKYFFADSSLTERPSAVGHFSIDKQALAAKDHEAIGLPFAILPRRDLSIKGDYHPWNPKEGATWDDHIAFAKSYSPGHIVAITPDTQLTGGAIDSIKQNNGRFAIVKITDQRARDAFRNNPSLIPRAVSPGFMNLETPNLEGIKNFRWAHLAAVPRGAYGDKATVYASCLGGNECVNHLVGASVAQLDSQLKNVYCPVGASENIAADNVNTSLGNFSEFKNSMSANATNTTEPSPPTTTTPVVSTVSAPPKGAPINTGTPSKGIVKLKNPVQQGQGVTPQGNNPNQQGQGDVNELEAVKKTLQELQTAQQQRERLEQIKKVIPKELFIQKGKFDEKGYEAEVEKRLQQGWTDEQLNEFYASRSEILKLTNAGYALPQEQQQEQQLGQIPQAPVGGSAYQYTTQTDVPATENNDMGMEALRLKAVNELRRWTRGY
jgi:hypothetical protein